MDNEKLHSHPGMESKLGVDTEHVIIDKKTFFRLLAQESEGQVNAYVIPEIAEEVEIHLNYSTDNSIRVYPYHSTGKRPELDFLIGMSVIEHHDNLELHKSYLYKMLVKLLKRKQKFIITGH